MEMRPRGFRQFLLRSDVEEEVCNLLGARAELQLQHDADCSTSLWGDGVCDLWLE